MPRRNARKRSYERVLERRISNAEIWIVIYLIISTVIVAILIGAALQRASAMFLNAGRDLMLRPKTFAYYLVAAPVAFLITTLGGEPIHKWLLGRPPDAFNSDYAFAASPYPLWFKRCAVSVLVVASLASVMFVRKHAVVSNTLILDQATFSVSPERYPLSEVRSVELARYYILGTKYSPGRVSNSTALFVKFHDGRIWSPNHSELDAGDQAALADLVSARSGVSVSYPDEIEDLPDTAGASQRVTKLLVVGSILALIGVAVFQARKHMVRSSLNMARSSKR